MAAKRFSTYFKTPIPPFKTDKMGSGTTTIRFVLKGSIPSLKNGRNAVVVRKDALEYIRDRTTNGMVSYKDVQYAISKKLFGKVTPNEKYRDWAKEQMPIILEQRDYWQKRLESKGLVFPLFKCTMSVRFYFNNHYKIDIISKQESLQDLLVAAKVIEDDNYTILNPIHSAAAEYKDELTESLCFVSISFKLPKKAK
jgi:hypothetical protein